MRARLSITLSCGKKFIHENRFIIHECLSFYYFELWKNVSFTKTDLSSTRAFSLLFGAVAKLSSTKPIYHPQELFFFYVGAAVERVSSTKPIYHLRELVFLFLWAVEN
jgi:hypothetical protein